MKNYIEKLQPPDQLAQGFMDFAKSVQKKCEEKEAKLTEEEMADLFNNSFPGKVRANFLFWVGDINDFVEATNIILNDFSDLRNDRNFFKGNPIVRSEFLLQSFFSEFFKAREISKIYLKILKNMNVLNNENKEVYIGFYLSAFDWVYKIRNEFIHLGTKISDFDVKLNLEFLKNISEEEKIKFIDLLKNSNTRENTIEIQCAYYMEIIIAIMNMYTEFQILVNNTLADLILSFEKHNIEITVKKTDNVNLDKA